MYLLVAFLKKLNMFRPAVLLRKFGTILARSFGRARDSMAQNVEVTDKSAGPAAAESQLIAAARSGDGPAFATLVGLYQRRILGLAQRITRNQGDAEDVLQRSLQRAFVHLSEFEGRSSFSSWLTRVAINEALMLLRRRRRLREVFFDSTETDTEDGAPVMQIPDSSLDPEERYSQQEREQILAVAMDELAPGQRAAIQLFELDGFSVKDTARIMDISVEAVKSRLFHGRRRLRKTRSLAALDPVALNSRTLHSES